MGQIYGVEYNMKKKSWVDILIEDEEKAIHEYFELSDVLMKLGYSKLSKLAESIMKDEEKHIKILEKIRDSMN